MNDLYEEGPDVNRRSFGLTTRLKSASGDELSSLYRFLVGWIRFFNMTR
jgi:hypothetical protein